MKTDIISNVSHELRTPITVSKGVFELLKKETPKEEMKKLLEMGDNSLNRLMEIVENLISAAKFHGGSYNISKEFIDLKELINNVLKSLEKKALQKNVLIKTSFSKDLKSIKGDPTELSRMLKNVVDNSIKFSKKEGGNVIIKADNFDSSVKISITDDGIGIPVDKITKIFEPLYQIDATSTREYDGTGMGLAVSKSLVKSHGGRIWAESESGKGTTVHISLPVEGIDSFYETVDWIEN